MLDEIVTIVRQAGDMLLQARDVESVTAEKHGAADLVTSYDLAVQDLLRRRLLALLPEADFLGEEGEHEALTKPWIFVADPIDGTANFVHDMHYSNVSVALVHEGVTEYAAVCDPYRGEVYAARRGGGAGGGIPGDFNVWRDRGWGEPAIRPDPGTGSVTLTLPLGAQRARGSFRKDAERTAVRKAARKQRILQYLTDHASAPAEELAAAAGIRTSGAERILQELREAGLVSVRETDGQRRYRLKA